MARNKRTCTPDAAVALRAAASAIWRVPPVSEWNTIRSVLIRAAEQDTVDDRM
jgi:hypothetical protein